jgi:hypothetical protein
VTVRARWIATALAGTLLLGVWLRWALAGTLPIWGDFGHIRHGHSHLGYFGVLFPLAWLGWRSVGAPVPGGRALRVYGLATAVAFAGFLRAGYGVEAIAGSTVVGGIWLISAWRLRRHVLVPDDALAPVLPGVILAELCIPFIAVTLDSSPTQAEGWVATFLALLLLMVLVPSSLAVRGVRLPGAPLFGLAGALGAAALGAWPGVLPRVGLGLYAVWLLRIALVAPRLPLHLRSAWAAVGLGLGGVAVAILPNVRPVAIGAIHFMILGPVVASLAPTVLRRAPVPEPAWWLGHGLVALLSVPLVLQGMGAGAWTLTASALGGTGVLAWWAWVLWLQLRASHDRTVPADNRPIPSHEPSEPRP